ncbi:MAG: formylmethanofuran dehydrogenase subunit C [Hyphomicrobiales bacterium]|nr:formylmethanofuran dehydrogenase subunit C [Hyphomicrobiales bacterium]
MTLTLTLKSPPPFRLDMSGVVPHLLQGLTTQALARLDVTTMRVPVPLGDWFRIAGTPGSDMVIYDACGELDQVGAALQGGNIVVAGNVGRAAGAGMSGGHITIHGHAGAYAGAMMRGGTLDIMGNAGDHLAGATVGALDGMTGGALQVRGHAGRRAGDRMRGGMIVINGHAGAQAGSRLGGGTLMVCGKAGPEAGVMMRRGTLYLNEAGPLPPGFVDCGTPDLVFHKWLAQQLQPYGHSAMALARAKLRRYQGDMADLGKGEIFLCAP